MGTLARRCAAVVVLALGPVLATTACGGDGGSGDAARPVPTTANSPSSTTPEVRADDIPVAVTPVGGWTEMPPPVLDRCTEPLVDGAVDMRGTWKVVSVEAGGVDAPGHAAIGQLQRIEQCGNRVVITAGGIVHDMRADGTERGAVHDVAASDLTTPITVIATFEDGVHVLRPAGTPIEVRRWIDDEQLVWAYVGFTARLDPVE